jgi:DNA-binding transcriptional LysR family regulator
MKELSQAQVVPRQTASAQMELRLWQQFVAVAEHLHFGRAAQQLNMTQPPLTQAIAGMEARLGARLFERTKRSVSLTPVGAGLLPGARELLSLARQLTAQAQAAGAGEVGRLRIGFVSPLGLGPLPGWVREFRRAHPAVKLELSEVTGDVQQHMFERDELDVGFVLHAPGFVQSQMARRRLGEEPMILAMPQQHPLAAQKTPLKLEQVLAEPLVLFPRRILPSIYEALQAVYESRGQRLNVAQEAIQMQTIVNLVSAGLGIAWVPQSVQAFQRSGVIYRDVSVAKKALLTCETSLIWRESSSHPARDRFVALVSAAISSPGKSLARGERSKT